MRITVLDWSPTLTHQLQDSLPEVRFSRRRTADEVAGIGLAAVIVATPQPLSDLSALLVHPELGDVPVLVVDMGHRIPVADSYPVVHVVHAFADQSDEVASALTKILAARRSATPALETSDIRVPVEV